MITRGQHGVNRQTAFRRLQGRCKRAEPPFLVLCLLNRFAGKKLRVDGQSAANIGAAAGAMRVRTIKHRPPDVFSNSAWVSALLRITMDADTWTTSWRGSASCFSRDFDRSNELPQDAPPTPAPIPRHIHIRKHIEQHPFGYTPNCLGCDGARTDLPSRHRKQGHKSIARELKWTTFAGRG